MSMAPQQADNTPSNFGVNQARARWALTAQANGGNYEGMLGQSSSNAMRSRSAARTTLARNLLVTAAMSAVDFPPRMHM